jgi:hypothetical protein
MCSFVTPDFPKYSTHSTDLAERPPGEANNSAIAGPNSTAPVASWFHCFSDEREILSGRYCGFPQGTVSTLLGKLATCRPGGG